MTIVINGTTGISGVDGSAGTPAVQGTDTNTGVFYPAADTVGVSTGGSERVRVDSSGNVGIGTSSPTSGLNLIDALSGGQLLVATNQTNATEKYGTFGTQHYTNAEEPVLGVAVQSNVTDNNILIGGALGEFNAATQVRFYTAANNTTVTGTERMRIDSSGNLLFNSGYGSVATAYGCRAWVNFNGTGTVAIRASGNVSSITDNGTGDYTVNFTTAMPDANYNAVSMGQRNDFNNGDMNISFYGNVYGTAIGTGSVRVNSAHASSYTLSDALTVCVAIFR